MDPLSMIGAGTNLLGGIFSAFGSNKVKDDWKQLPGANAFKAQADQAYRGNMDSSQGVRNLGSFLDAKRNMKAGNASVGALMQSGGAYSGSLLNAVNAGNALNGALNYDSTLNAQAQAGQMDIGSRNQRTAQESEYANMSSLQQTQEPDFMSRIGSALSGAQQSVMGGAKAGSQFGEMFKKRGGNF